MRCILAWLISLGFASTCCAAPITFIHEGSGSGTLDGGQFSSRPFVITAHGDTANRQFQTPGIPYIDHSSVQINLSGLGTFAITSPTRTFVNQGSSLVGFSRAGSGGLDLLNGPANSVYQTWDMQTPIGPHSGLGNLLQWSGPSFTNVNTTGGILVFDSAATQATFTARIPEPSAVLLAAAAAIVFIFSARCF